MSRINRRRPAAPQGAPRGPGDLRKNRNLETVALRGSAWDYNCERCGGQAESWEYVGGDPAEQWMELRQFGDYPVGGPQFHAALCDRCGFERMAYLRDHNTLDGYL